MIYGRIGNSQYLDISLNYIFYGLYYYQFFYTFFLYGEDCQKGKTTAYIT